MCNLEQEIEQFVLRTIDPARPMLIGLSGGADSMCLFHLLYACSKKMALKLHICHVDHAWRQESAMEQREMIALAKRCDVPITTTRLNPSTYVGNREAEARVDRLNFFTRVSQETNAQGIFLAHHADDQVETTFKRFLEGGMLLYLGGIREVTNIGQLTLFRPLLRIPKQELLDYVATHTIQYFEDPTNFNPTYLRGRLRTEVFPFLRTSFGKEFSESILRISQDAQEMRSYFDAKVDHLIQKRIPGPFGMLFDLSDVPPLHRVEYKEFFRRVGELCELSLNRTQLETALQLLQSGIANKTLLVQDKTLYFDRKRLFVFTSQEKERFETVDLEPSGACASWKISVKRGKGERKNSWLDIWKGKLASTIPADSRGYFLAEGKTSLRCSHSKKSLQRLYNDAKVPNKLTTMCPVVLSTEQEVVEDFCRGKSMPEKDAEDLLYIELEKIYTH